MQYEHSSPRPNRTPSSRVRFGSNERGSNQDRFESRMFEFGVLMKWSTV